MRKKIFLTLFLLGVCLIGYFLWNELTTDESKYKTIEAKLNEIDKDTLSKYYQIFSISAYNQDYDENDFKSFLQNRNAVLEKKISEYDIKLNSEVKSLQTGVFEGFYHIGPDGVDNNAKNIIIDPKANLDGDILLPTHNYFDFKENRIYGVKKDKVVDLGEFNAVKIVSKSIECEGKVKIKLDTIDYGSNALVFNDQKMKIKKNIDKRTLDIILKDPKLLSIVKEYSDVYVPFNHYKPFANFYCDN